MFLPHCEPYETVFRKFVKGSDGRPRRHFINKCFVGPDLNISNTVFKEKKVNEVITSSKFSKYLVQGRGAVVNQYNYKVIDYFTQGRLTNAILYCTKEASNDFYIAEQLINSHNTKANLKFNAKVLLKRRRIKGSSDGKRVRPVRGQPLELKSPVVAIK